MNERIRELIQAADRKCSETRGVYDEILAELIVGRCIQVCDGNHEYKNRTDTDFGKGVSIGIQMSKEQIKAHFGVEE